MQKYLLGAVADAVIEVPSLRYPLIMRSAVTSEGETIRFLLNYSSEPLNIPSQWSGTDLLSGTAYTPGQEISLPDWGVQIICCNDK